MEESSGHVTKGGAKRFALLQGGSKLTVPPATWKRKLSLRGMGRWGVDTRGCMYLVPLCPFLLLRPCRGLFQVQGGRLGWISLIGKVGLRMEDYWVP